MTWRIWHTAPHDLDPDIFLFGPAIGILPDQMWTPFVENLWTSELGIYERFHIEVSASCRGSIYYVTYVRSSTNFTEKLLQIVTYCLNVGKNYN